MSNSPPPADGKEDGKRARSNSADQATPDNTKKLRVSESPTPDRISPQNNDPEPDVIMSGTENQENVPPAGTNRGQGNTSTIQPPQASTLQPPQTSTADRGQGNPFPLQPPQASTPQPPQASMAGHRSRQSHLRNAFAERDLEDTMAQSATTGQSRAPGLGQPAPPRPFHLQGQMGTQGRGSTSVPHGTADSGSSKVGASGNTQRHPLAQVSTPGARSNVPSGGNTQGTLAPRVDNPYSCNPNARNPVTPNLNSILTVQPYWATRNTSIPNPNPNQITPSRLTTSTPQASNRDSNQTADSNRNTGNPVISNQTPNQTITSHQLAGVLRNFPSVPLTRENVQGMLGTPVAGISTFGSPPPSTNTASGTPYEIGRVRVTAPRGGNSAASGNGTNAASGGGTNAVPGAQAQVNTPRPRVNRIPGATGSRQGCRSTNQGRNAEPQTAGDTTTAASTAATPVANTPAAPRISLGNDPDPVHLSVLETALQEAINRLRSVGRYLHQQGEDRHRHLFQLLREADEQILAAIGNPEIMERLEGLRRDAQLAWDHLYEREGLHEAARRGLANESYNLGERRGYNRGYNEGYNLGKEYAFDQDEDLAGLRGMMKTANDANEDLEANLKQSKGWLRTVVHGTARDTVKAIDEAEQAGWVFGDEDNGDKDGDKDDDEDGGQDGGDGGDNDSDNAKT